MSNPSEVWQVEVGGQVYEASFAELGEWIGDGALQPDDKVRRGNLRWIEARKVPTLLPFFNAKDQGLPMPVVVTTTEPEPAATEAPQAFTTENFATPVAPAVFTPEPVEHSVAVPPTPVVQAVPVIASTLNPDICAMHPEVPSSYVCDGCGNGFCKVCPKSYSTVRICPLCGAMCRTTKEFVDKRSKSDHRATAIAEGFGSADFFRALSHPFNFKASLFFGAIMFAFFSIGQSVASIGGIYMIVSSLFCYMFANMLTFGVLANTIDSFAHGHTENNFMPSFEDFELWDDVIHPLFLSIGAYLSAFGPFILVMLIGFYVVVSSVQSEMQTFQQDVEKIPGTHYYDAQRTLDQSQKVKTVLGNVADEHNATLQEHEDAALGATDGTAAVENQAQRENREQEELWAAAQESRKQSLEAALGKSPETQAKERDAMVQNFLALAPPLVVIGAIFFLWGAFYFPAACAVAGYTRSFVATISPMVGLDTIKRLGMTYAKILLMGLVLVIISAIAGTIFGAVLAPFDLPGFGNLPAKAIGGVVGFYLWTVFSCILGYAMFKNSDKLAIRS